jgi:hypothetical protein
MGGLRRSNLIPEVLLPLFCHVPSFENALMVYAQYVRPSGNHEFTFLAF